MIALRAPDGLTFRSAGDAAGGIYALLLNDGAFTRCWTAYDAEEGVALIDRDFDTAVIEQLRGMCSEFLTYREIERGAR
jgi:hypothetical protein